MDVIEFQPPEADNNEKLKSKNPDILYDRQSEEEVQLKEMKDRQEKKKTGLLMGKLHDDMIFLDKGGFKKYPFNRLMGVYENVSMNWNIINQ